MNAEPATPRDRIEFAAYSALSSLLRALPEGPALAVGGALGALAGGALRIRREVVDANLRRAFPEAGPRWRQRVALESYRHLGREAVATLRLARLPRETLLGRTEVEGLEGVLEAARGAGAVVATGHLGNWEVAGGALALRGAPLDAVAVRQRNPLFNAALVENRERLGIAVVYRGSAWGAVLRSVRRGRVPVLLADQDGGWAGIFVDFFGHPASTARGPALLAIRSGARLFGGACRSLPGRPRRYHVVLEPIDVAPTGDLDEDVRRLTQAHADFLARHVREAPEQYFWQHKRWKTRPEGGVPERPQARPV